MVARFVPQANGRAQVSHRLEIRSQHAPRDLQSLMVDEQPRLRPEPARGVPLPRCGTDRAVAEAVGNPVLLFGAVVEGKVPGYMWFEISECGKVLGQVRRTEGTVIVGPSGLTGFWGDVRQ